MNYPSGLPDQYTDFDPRLPMHPEMVSGLPPPGLQPPPGVLGPPGLLPPVGAHPPPGIPILYDTFGQPMLYDFRPPPPQFCPIPVYQTHASGGGGKEWQNACDAFLERLSAKPTPPPGECSATTSSISPVSKKRKSSPSEATSSESLPKIPISQPGTSSPPEKQEHPTTKPCKASSSDLKGMQLQSPASVVTTASVPGRVDNGQSGLSLSDDSPFKPLLCAFSNTSPDKHTAQILWQLVYEQRIIEAKETKQHQDLLNTLIEKIRCELPR